MLRGQSGISLLLIFENAENEPPTSWNSRSVHLDNIEMQQATTKTLTAQFRTLKTLEVSE